MFGYKLYSYAAKDTALAKAKGGDSMATDVIKNWIRSRTTLEFLWTWEQMNNPGFKVVEFDHFVKVSKMVNQGVTL